MTSSSDAPSGPHGSGGASGLVQEVVRHQVAAAGVRAREVRLDAARPVAIRIVERGPPPPPPLDVTPLARSLAAGFAALREQLDAAFAAIERECVELALAAAEQVVRRRAQRGELELEEPLRAILASRRRELAETPAKLRLHPEDAKTLAPKAAGLAPAGARIELVADPAQPRGQLALELGAARVVRTIDHELKQLRQRLLGGAHSKEPS